MQFEEEIMIMMHPLDRRVRPGCQVVESSSSSAHRFYSTLHSFEKLKQSEDSRAALISLL